MALAIDGSSPAVVTSTAGVTVTSASFTPPSGSVLLVSWAGNSGPGSTPSSPTITDNLGVHLTYTLIGWRSHADAAPSVDGQAAMWWAVVGTSAAMTVTVTNGDGSDPAGNALKVRVLTGADTTTPIGASGKAASASAASIAQAYTASASNGWGFIADCDWDLKGAQSAGTGCASDGSANVGGSVSYGFMRRTTADDSAGVSNTLNVTIPATSTHLSWVYAEVLPAAGTGTSANAGNTTGTGTANDAVVSAAANDSGTSATGAALDATVSTAFTVNAGNTTGTGTANDVVAAVSANDTGTTATAAANDATVSTSSTVNAAADVASAVGSAPFDTTGGTVSLDLIADNPIDITGAALDAAVTVMANAGVTAASGQALDATVTTTATGSAPADVAVGSATAVDASVDATTLPAAIAASASALDATISTVAATSASAEVATGTCAASDSAVTAAVLAEAASILAAAWAALAQGPIFNARSSATVTATRSSSTAVTAGSASTATVSDG